MICDEHQKPYRNKHVLLSKENLVGSQFPSHHDDAGRQPNSHLDLTCRDTLTSTRQQELLSVVLVDAKVLQSALLGSLKTA